MTRHRSRVLRFAPIPLVIGVLAALAWLRFPAQRPFASGVLTGIVLFVPSLYVKEDIEVWWQRAKARLHGRGECRKNNKS